MTVETDNSVWKTVDLIPLEKALTYPTNKIKLYVYRIKVGGKSCIEISKTDVDIRFDYHKEKAMSGDSDPLYVNIRKYAYIFEIETLSENIDELRALVSKFSACEEHRPELNIKPYGYSDSFSLVESVNQNGESRLFIETAKRRHQLKKNSHEYLEALIQRLINRYEAIYNKYPDTVISWINDLYNGKHVHLKNYGNKFFNTPFHGIIDEISIKRSRRASFIRTDAEKLHKYLYYKYKKFLNWDEDLYRISCFIQKYDLQIFRPNRPSEQMPSAINGTGKSVIDFRRMKFDQKKFNGSNRMFYLGNYFDADKFRYENIEEAESRFKSSNFYSEGESLGMFRHGDCFYSVWVECGTYSTGFLGMRKEKNYRPAAIYV
jgi:hypothetical protein